NAAMSTVASAGTSSPTNAAVSTATTTNTTHGPIPSRSATISWSRNSMSALSPLDAGPNVVLRVPFAVGAGGTHRDRVATHDQIVPVAPGIPPLPAPSPVLTQVVRELARTRKTAPRPDHSGDRLRLVLRRPPVDRDPRSLDDRIGTPQRGVP